MRSISTLFLCLFLSTLLVGQSKYSFGFNTQVGVSGKVNPSEDVSRFGTSDFYQISGNRIVGVAGAGFWAAYDFSPKIALRTGLQYQSSGNEDYRESYSEDILTGQIMFPSSYSISFRTNQIQVPLEFQIRIGQGKMQPTLSFGAQYSYDWIGSIYAETTFFQGADQLESVNEWTPDRREDFRMNGSKIQPVLGVGLRINDQMHIRVRRTWIGQDQLVSWRENFEIFEPVLSPDDPIVIICGTPYHYRANSTHRQTTTLEISYRLF